jgi:hypothetical protein
MQVHSLINSSSFARQLPVRFPAAELPENNEAPVRPKPVRSHGSRATTGTFITPQSIMAFPFASSLVAGIWQAIDSLGLHDHNYTGFLVALLVGAVVYAITVSDPRLRMTRAERWAGLGIGLINCMYLYMAAFAIHQFTHPAIVLGK